MRPTPRNALRRPTSPRYFSDTHRSPKKTAGALSMAVAALLTSSGTARSSWRVACSAACCTCARCSRLVLWAFASGSAATGRALHHGRPQSTRWRSQHRGDPIFSSGATDRLGSFRHATFFRSGNRAQHFSSCAIFGAASQLLLQSTGWRRLLLAAGVFLSSFCLSGFYYF